MLDSSPEPYAVVRMGLRAPRIAIMFDCDYDDWSFLVRRASFLSCQHWGGAGFSFVPHRSGAVDAVALRACAAYDPDYVVVMPQRIGDLKSPSSRSEPAVHTDTESDQPIAEASDDETIGATAEDERAREQVLAVCSSYRRRFDSTDLISQETTEGMSWDEVRVDLEEQAPLPEVLTFPEATTPVSLACPPSWGGVVGAAVASWAGAVERPARDSQEPDLDENDLAKLAVWLLGGEKIDLPRAMIHFPNGVHTGVLTEQLPDVHARTMTGLSLIHQGHDRRVPWLVVLGDEPEDLALARAWNQIHGYGYWLPSTFRASGGQAEAQIRSQLGRMLHQASRTGAELILTSTSRTADDLASDAAALAPVPIPMGRQKVLKPNVVAARDLKWKQRRRTHLGVSDQYDSSYPVPVATTETGTRTMMAPLPAPLPHDPRLAAVSPPIQVDISWEEARSVSGHGLLGDHLRSPSTDPYLTWIRASRAGTSFQAERYDMVLAGMQAETKTARPRLRDLGLRDWVTAICEDSNLAVRTSPAGHHGAQLARMLGSRVAFVDLFSGPLLTAMRDMRPTAKSTPDAYPDGDGVRIDQGFGCLTFEGVHARTRGLKPEETRDLLDAALDSGVLRRGLALLCGICEQAQFVQVDRLGQRWSCIRCDASNALNRTAWKMPNNEPAWYYDLHPVGHNLLANNGEVPALLSAHLRSKVRGNSRLHDIDEVELLRGGKAIVELDLVACMDDSIVIAECKSPGNLGVNGKGAGLREVNKKCEAAKLLRADILIFATAAQQWESATKEWISEAVGKFNFGPLNRPVVELIEDLNPSITGADTDES